MNAVNWSWVRSRYAVWGLAFSSLAVAAAILFAFRADLDKAQVALVFLLVVLASSASGGRALGAAIAVTAFLIFDWFFLPPYNTLLLRNPLDWVVLVAFLITSFVAAELLYRARAERAAVERAEALREADKLKDASITLTNSGSFRRWRRTRMQNSGFSYPLAGNTACTRARAVLRN